MKTNTGFVYNIINSIEINKEKSIITECKNGEIFEHKNIDLLNDVLEKTNYFFVNKIKNEKICFVFDTSYESLVLFFSILASGNIAIIFNPKNFINDFEKHIQKIEFKYVCCDEKYIDDCNKLNGIKKLLSNKDIKSTKKINKYNIYNSDGNETVIIMCTSGTTGESKYVEITSKSMNNICTYKEEKAKDEIEFQSTYVSAPFYHMMGLNLILRRIMFSRKIYIETDPKQIFKSIQKASPEAIVGVPLLLETIAKLEKEKDFKEIVGENIKALCFSGAKCDKRILEHFSKKNIYLLSGYSMTEAPEIFICELKNNNQYIGKPSKLYETKIVDGELLVKGESMMKGYYNDEDETSKTIVDGWLHTGDLVKKDKNGNYYLIGRKKNTIILSNGENVNPEEIENKLMEFGGIEECIVYDDGKMICIDVYTQEEDKAKESIEKYNKSVPTYYKIRKINFLQNKLERTTTGKIKRRRTNG